MLNKKVIALCLVTMALLGGCANNSNNANGQDSNKTSQEQQSKFSGTKTYEHLYDATGKKGDVVVTNVEFKDGEPVNVTIDVRQESGSMKKQDSKDGKYVMREGEEKAWHEQVELLENFLKDNKFDISKITLGENGNTDAITGVSIKISSYLDGVKAIVDSVKNNTELEQGFSGIKEIVVPYDSTGAKKDEVIAKVTFNNNKPVNVSIDVKLEDGTMKKELSANGGYVMKEGEEKAWHEQITELEKFIIDNKFDLSKITLSDKGNTDAITGVSIKIGSYVEAVQKALDEVK